MLKARVQRWEALWSIRKRKLQTRAKIIIGAAVLAELAARQASADRDDGFAARLTDLLDRLVPRVSDRAALRDLTGLKLPLRPGGAPGETYEQALAAIGELDPDWEVLVGSGDWSEGDEGEEYDW